MVSFTHFFSPFTYFFRKFLQALKLVTLAESLGGYESLAELPYLMTHSSIEEKERIALGVTETLIRYLHRGGAASSSI